MVKRAYRILIELGLTWTKFCEAGTAQLKGRAKMSLLGSVTVGAKDKGGVGGRSKDKDSGTNIGEESIIEITAMDP